MHIPVLRSTVCTILSPSPGEDCLDCTLGLGGHSEEFLKMTIPDGVLIGLDADTQNLALATERLSTFGDRALLLHANFGDLPDCLPEDRRSFDVILADLGLSSPHIDNPDRGFTFQDNAPLDMRFDQTQGVTAADILNTHDDDALVHIFQNFGELPRTYRFVRAINDYRKDHTFSQSDDLNTVIQTVFRHDAKKVTAQIYQALRIAVNDELAVLGRLLQTASSLLTPNGRFGVISYHSLEDRMVKHTFRALTTAPKDPITGAETEKPQFALLTKKAIMPTDEEVRENPRARSAKFRAITKTSH